MTSPIHQAARLLATRTGDTVDEAERCIRTVCVMCQCDVDEASACLAALLRERN